MPTGGGGSATETARALSSVASLNERSAPLESFTEILSGLREGDQVVTSGSFSLKAEALKAMLEEEH